MVGVVTLPLLLDLTNSFFVAEQDIAKTRIQIEQLDLNLLQAKERRNQQIREKEFQKHQGAGLFADEYLPARQRNSQPNQWDGVGDHRKTESAGQCQHANPEPAIRTGETRSLAFPVVRRGQTRGDKYGSATGPSFSEKGSLWDDSRECDFGFGDASDASIAVANPAKPNAGRGVFGQQGAPIYAVVDLKIATNTSGFQWTSRKGPEMRMTSGTLCEGTITLTTRSPMSLVLPLVKNSIGL